MRGADVPGAEVSGAEVSGVRGARGARGVAPEGADPRSDGRPDGLDAHLRVQRGDLTLGLSLRVDPGEVLGLVGPNGTGKTTALHALAGLLPVQPGTRTVLDGVVLDGPGRWVAPAERGIGVVFQDHRVVPHLSVLENVAFGLRAQHLRASVARTEAARWLGRFDLTAIARTRGAHLSGGQAQRVALARALAVRPRLLLLDEPFAALDTAGRTAARTLLHEHLRAWALPTVLVSHDPEDLAHLADRQVRLVAGAAGSVGTPPAPTSTGSS